jgi:IS5 family transposase
VEHVFAVLKRLWGLTKVRYRGLANLYLARQRLMA